MHRCGCDVFFVFFTDRPSSFPSIVSECFVELIFFIQKYPNDLFSNKRLILPLAFCLFPLENALTGYIPASFDIKRLTCSFMELIICFHNFLCFDVFD